MTGPAYFTLPSQNLFTSASSIGMTNANSSIRLPSARRRPATVAKAATISTAITNE